MTSKPETHRLWLEITLALAIKTVALITIWLVWFSAPEEPVVDTKQVASRFFPPQPAKEHNHDSIHRAR